jgi:hypothetical protein
MYNADVQSPCVAGGDQQDRVDVTRSLFPARVGWLIKEGIEIVVESAPFATGRDASRSYYEGIL